MQQKIEEIKSFFRIYLKEYIKILKKYQYTKLEKKGQNLRLKLIQQLREAKALDLLMDYTALVLYYGTKLSSEEVVEVRSGDLFFVKGKLIRVRNNDNKGTLLLDEECSAWLEELLNYQKKERLIFSNSNYTVTSERLNSIIFEYPHEEILEQLTHCFPIYEESDYEVIPTPLRLNADMRYTGKGVTIAFIDSGFYPHPDITKPVNRVLKYVNVADPNNNDFGISQASSWHGMQTSLSSAGNGYLSNGLYRGIASEANLVLLKVSGEDGIETVDIIKAIEWCIKHKEEYNIRILNISLGGDKASSYLENALDQAAEGAVQAGIVVLVAVGNDGDSHNIIAPPASAPSVITVGGLDDKNNLDVNSYTMYRSSYGITIDGLMKPEIIAPGIWVAAPILPNTPFFEEAKLLSELKNEPDEKIFFEKVKANLAKIHLHESILSKKTSDIKRAIQHRISMQKIVGTYYQHVDGTSFSAPIVASVIAQMIEANPNLNPRRVKQILTQTTDKLFNVPKEKQGHGLIHARKAVKEALNDIHRIGYNRQMSPHVKGKIITFYYIDDKATSVSVAGDFNGWNSTSDFFIKEGKNLWKLEKEIKSVGSYRYKFVINGKIWVLDKENENKEPDGFGSFNNRLNIFI